MTTSLGTFGESILDRQYGRHRFVTVPPVTDRAEGFTAIRLLETVNEQTTMCAEIIYWDANGQFSLTTFARQVPTEIIEELIAEAKEKIKFR